MDEDEDIKFCLINVVGVWTSLPFIIEMEQAGSVGNSVSPLQFGSRLMGEFEEVIAIKTRSPFLKGLGAVGSARVSKVLFDGLMIGLQNGTQIRSNPCDSAKEEG